MPKVKICPSCGCFFLQGKKTGILKAAECIAAALDTSPKTVIRQLREGLGISGVSIQKTLCTPCSRAKSGYFEAILQLRNTSSPAYSKALEKILADVQEPGVIAKIVSGKDGKDFYFTSRKKAKSLQRQLHREYGGTVLSSAKLYSRDRQTSRKTFRHTFLLRLPRCFPGQAVACSGEACVVVRVQKDIVHCTRLSDQKNTRCRVDDIETLPLLTAHVASRKPALLVLDPEDYQPKRVENPRDVRRDTVKIVKHWGRIFLAD